MALGKIMFTDHTRLLACLSVRTHAPFTDRQLPLYRWYNMRENSALYFSDYAASRKVAGSHPDEVNFLN
jgi:hypothetical protein